MKKYILLSLLGVFLLSSCNKSPEVFDEPEAPEATSPITKTVFSGIAQKGPYINGSSITIATLDENLNQTGSVFSTQIIDNAGNFEQKNIEFASNFIELKADGYYFNEVKGETSTGSLTLYALADITDINSVNINILTHLERQRIFYLAQEKGLSFAAAKKQARTEVLEIFKFALPDSIASESLNITDNAVLLAASVIVQGQLSTGDMSELLANMSSDIRTDGKLDNAALGSQLMNNVAYLNLEQVISNMEKKYSGLGISLNINGAELKSYIEQFKNNSGFEQTLTSSGITYPKSGKYGPNILSDEVVVAKRTEWGRYEYSVRAELPEGNSSLRIVIKTKVPFFCARCQSEFTEHPGTCPVCGGFSDDHGSPMPNSVTELPWGGYNHYLDASWLASRIPDKVYAMTFTAAESGKTADMLVILERECIIEYYENGATTPTKVKNLYVGGDAEEDDEHEREMLIAFYKSTNGDNWIRNDNWCSDKPIAQWYGITTLSQASSVKNQVSSIKLPNNNLTGSAHIADLRSLYELNILNGNKIESLTIDNCGNNLPFTNLNNYHTAFYHDQNYSQVNLKTLKISNTNGYIYANGNFSADSVIISNCKLSAQEYMSFSSPSTTIGTLTVSNCTMGYFYADSSVIGNIIIDNCTFLEGGYGAYIYVGNRTQVNNCKGLRYIYSSRQCSDLIVTNTICNDIQCKN